MISKEDLERTATYSKDQSQESFLQKLNDSLSNLEESYFTNQNSKHPFVFIVGAQRSGTTVVNQILTNHFDFWYPNNFIARIWRAPIVATQLYKATHKDDCTNTYSSKLGYTPSPSGPHEFGYFWRQWFGQEFEKDLEVGPTLTQQLHSISTHFDRPLLFKNLIYLSNHISVLHALLPGNCLFIRLKRDPASIACSSYNSRIRLYNDSNKWFGVKPPEYQAIQKLPVLEQVVSQVYHTEKQIDRQIAQVPDQRKIVVDYDVLCDAPEIELKKLFGFLEKNGIHKNDNTLAFAPTKSINQMSVDDSQVIDKLVSKYFDR